MVKRNSKKPPKPTGVENKSKKDLLEETKKAKARYYSIKEGIFATGRVALGDSYIAPFAIAINMSNSLVAMLTSIAGLLGPLSQTFSSRLMEKTSRKKIILKALLLECLIWLPMIAIAILYMSNTITNLLPLILVLTYSLFVILANASSPAWFSWMGDIVDEKERGMWFAQRNLLTGFVAVVFAISASFFLEFMKEKSLTMYGFIILFTLAFLFRFYSRSIFKKQYEPKLKLEKGYYFSFGQFIIEGRKTNFGKFTFFRFWLSLTGSISSPLVAIYLLRELNFKYSTYMIIILSATVFTLLVIEIWGKFADSYGNYKTMALTSILIPLIPVLWILHPSPIYLIFIPSLVGGIAWAGFNLASSNFIYDNISIQKRGLAVSYYNLVIGIGTFIGAGIGAILIKYLTIEIIKPLFAIFIIGTLARMIVVFYWLPKIKEVRKTKKFNKNQAFKNLILKNGAPTINQEIHQIASIKKYVFE